MPAHLISVRPDRTGRWYVESDDGQGPLSTHGSQTDAERAALARAGELGDARVLVVDRYMRSRELTPRRRR